MNQSKEEISKLKQEVEQLTKENIIWKTESLIKESQLSKIVKLALTLGKLSERNEALFIRIIAEAQDKNKSEKNIVLKIKDEEINLKEIRNVLSLLHS